MDVLLSVVWFFWVYFLFAAFILNFMAAQGLTSIAVALVAIVQASV